MGKRANIRHTRRATETLVVQNRAAHLREQGLIGPAAGPGEAQQFDAAAAKADLQRRIAENRANAGPRRGLWFGLVMAVAAVLLWQVAPLGGFIVGLVALAALLIWGLSAGVDGVFRVLDRR